jgi:hypothetical protein
MDTVMDMAIAVARGWVCARQGDAAIRMAITMRIERDAKFRDIAFILVPPGGRIEAACPKRVRTC